MTNIIDTVKKNLGTIGLIAGGLAAAGFGAFKALRRGDEDYYDEDDTQESEDDNDEEAVEAAEESTDDAE